MKKKNDIIYSLNIDDIQEVAMQELDRELTPEEIKKLIDPIAEKIPWYEAIADSINEQFGESENSDDE